MKPRIITITIEGEGRNYGATIDRIIKHNRKLFTACPKKRKPQSFTR